ncbi:MAG: hypothetical protein ACXW1P_08900, partial [Methylophilaceae bacterium]
MAVNLAPTFKVGTGLFVKSNSDINDARPSLSIQADGKFISASLSKSGQWDIVRLYSNGSLDSNFGNGGEVLLNVGLIVNNVVSTSIQPDGKIIVAGTSQNQFCVVRLNINGSLDTTFNGNGIAHTPPMIGNW